MTDNVPPEFSADSALCDDVRVSPNVNERKSGPTDILLLHYTGMDDAETSLKWLCMERSQVSCHYFVFEDGRIVQSVPEDKRAWHAGVASWKGERDINSRSIGIEIAHPGHDGGYPDFQTVQMDAVLALCKDICTRHAIVPHRVLAHSDVAPLRKKDPGEKFPWGRFSEGGIGHWVAEAPQEGGRFLQRGEEGAPVEALQAMLALYGYGVDVTGVFDEETEFTVIAFQRHFRPSRVDGIADVSTIKTLHHLIETLPSA